MRVRRLRWDSFRIPLATRFETAHGPLICREGLVLRLTTDGGLEGVGEISPFPAFDGTTLDEATSELARLAPEIIGARVEDLLSALASRSDRGARVPSVRHGLDVAGHDAIARQVGISVAELMAERVERVVPVNATVAAADLGAAVARSDAAVAAGFRCVKLKVGMAATIESEVARVAAVREAIGSGVTLRLDANGAWDVDRAIATLRALDGFDLEVVEQPVAGPDLAGLAAVRRATRIPLAADEAVTGIAAAREILDRAAADALVVKPMVLGGLGPAREVIQLARAAGCGVIVTTTVDAGIGVAAALQLAATLPQPGFAAGLATGPLLTGDIVAVPLVIDRGTLALPTGPGLGVAVDPEQLERFASGIRGEAGD